MSEKASTLCFLIDSMEPETKVRKVLKEKKKKKKGKKRKEKKECNQKEEL
jgi:hypothetical protein